MTLDINYVALVLSVVSLVVTVLAFFASLGFYRAGMNHQVKANEALIAITSTTATIQNQVGDQFSKVLDAAIAHTTIDDKTVDIVRQALAGARNVAEAQGPSEKKEAELALKGGIAAAAEELRSTLLRLASDSSTREVHAPWADPLVATVAADSAGRLSISDADWIPFLSKMYALERTHEFLSLRWLMEKRFAAEPDSRLFLQIALNKGFLEKYSLSNPKNPSYPTTCCRLNQSQSVVKAAIASVAKEG